MWRTTQQRYRNIAEWPLMGTALVFLAAYAWQVIVALPFFRPLRLLRLVTLLSVLHRTIGETLRGRVVTYMAGSAALLVCGALAVLGLVTASIASWLVQPVEESTEAAARGGRAQGPPLC
jgi:hypothetical protein